jgi:hypothetical protein
MHRDPARWASSLSPESFRSPRRRASSPLNNKTKQKFSSLVLNVFPYSKVKKRFRSGFNRGRDRIGNPDPDGPPKNGKIKKFHV